MHLDEMFPGKYLKAGNLKGQSHAVTIESISFEEVGGENKPVAHFAGKEMACVLNKTKGMVLAAAYGPDSNGWIGKDILLSPGKTAFQGKMVDCINVTIPERTVETPAAPAAQPADDEPPF